VASSFGGKKKAPAKIEELDKYLEMLYDDTEKCDAVARILDLCQNTAANNDWLEVVGRNG
jgi:hypothetical protein